MGFEKEITARIAAGYSLLYVRTYEELRARIALKKVTEELSKKFYLWSFTVGLCEVKGEELQKIDNTQQPEELMEFLFDKFSETEMSVVVLCDFHDFLNESLIMKRMVRELGSRFKEKGNNLILLSPVYKLPPELHKDVTLVEFELPGKQELQKIVEEIGEENEVKDLSNGDMDKVLESLKGLTTTEAENALALSVYNHDSFDSSDILKTKSAVIKKSGVLEYYEADETMKDVGGFPRLKAWLKLRGMAFTKAAIEYGIAVPKGMLLTGIAGCGKSLIAKAVANMWGLPLIRLDMGRVFGSLVGQSEENIRDALALAEAVAPCVLFIDEIEKGLAGAGGGGKHDSGVTTRVFGKILTWMQEKKEHVFVVATANDISALPAPLLRKGRFDELFFVDLPNAGERKEIFEIHLKKKNRNPKRFNLDVLVEKTEDFTGSEIEEVVKSALFLSYADDARELETKDMVSAIERTIPLSKTMAVELEGIRKWSKGRAVNVSGSDSEKKLLKKKRIRKIVPGSGRGIFDNDNPN